MDRAESLPEKLIVTPWRDPATEATGFPVNSIYTETVMLPIIGPTSVLCLRRLGAWAAADPGGITIESRQLARDMGLSDSIGRNAAITRTINRLCQFSMAHRDGDSLAVRIAVPPLSDRLVYRLSPALTELHRGMVRQRDQQRRTQLAQTQSCSPRAVRAVERPGVGI